MLQTPESEQLERLFWHYIYERQWVFEKRRLGNPPPWTQDTVIQQHRFTNVYRAADRVSQYLIKHVLYTGSQAPEEVIFRSLLFRIFNQIATWQVWERNLGGQPTLDTWNSREYGLFLDEAISQGVQIWNNAYMITPPLDTYGGGKKHEGWLHVLNLIVRENGPAKLATERTLEGVYKRLLAFPTVGPFFAMQWTADLAYSIALMAPEDTFVQPGGGAIRGIAKYFPSRTTSPSVTIRWLTDRQEQGLAAVASSPFNGFPYLGWPKRHYLQLMDIQNCLCESDKWAREAHPELSLPGRWYQRIKQSYNPERAQRNEPIVYFWPPKWGIGTKQPPGVVPVETLQQAAERLRGANGE